MRTAAKILSLFLIVSLVSISQALPIVTPTDYGNGVLFFNCNDTVHSDITGSFEQNGEGFETGEIFGPSLAEYLANNPIKTIKMVTPVNVGYGQTTGYIVYVVNKTKMVCDTTDYYNAVGTADQYTCHEEDI